MFALVIVIPLTSPSHISDIIFSTKCKFPNQIHKYDFDSCIKIRETTGILMYQTFSKSLKLKVPYPRIFKYWSFSAEFPLFTDPLVVSVHLQTHQTELKSVGPSHYGHHLAGLTFGHIMLRIWNTFSDEFYPEEGVPTGGVLAVTCFGLKINELPYLIAMDIFRALFVDDLAICFRGRSLDTIERHLQQAVNSIQEGATRDGFWFAAHKCKVVHFTAPRNKAQRSPTIRINDALLPVEESTKFLGLWWDSCLSFKKHISALKTLKGSQSHLSGCTLEVGRGQRHYWCCTGPLFAPS